MSQTEDIDTNVNTDDDLFGRPSRGAFPKIEELDTYLLLIKPSKHEKDVQGKYGKQDRVTADVVVLDGPDDAPYEIEDMYISSAGIVPTLARCLKPGNKPYVLGRLQQFPQKDWRDKAEKAGDGDGSVGIRKLLKDYFQKGGKGEKPLFSWGLDGDWTDADAAKARAWINAHSGF